MKNKVGRPKSKKRPDPIVASRIQKIREDNGFTQSEFSLELQDVMHDKYCYDQKTISNWERGETKPSDEVLRAIHLRFNAPLEWLRNDEGRSRELAWENINLIGKLGIMLGKESLPTVAEYYKKIVGNGSIRTSNLESDFDYLTHIIKQAIELMDSDLDEIEYLGRSMKNANENFIYLKNRRNKIDSTKGDK